MKQIPTVYELRKKGWKVRVGHHRKYFKYDAFSGKKLEKFLLRSEYKESYNDFYLDAKGGLTCVTITIPDLNKDYSGVSECSDGDAYRKRLGLKKALARALASLE